MKCTALALLLSATSLCYAMQLQTDTPDHKRPDGPSALGTLIHHYEETHVQQTADGPVIVHEDGTSSTIPEFAHAAAALRAAPPLVPDTVLQTAVDALEKTKQAAQTYSNKLATHVLPLYRFFSSPSVRLTAAAAGIGGIAGLIALLQRPTTRGLKSFVLEKAFLLVIVGGAFAVYKVKSLWSRFTSWRMKRENKALAQALNELKPAFDSVKKELQDAVDRLKALEGQYESLKAEDAAHYEKFDAQLHAFNEQTTLLNTAMQTTFGELRANFLALQAPIDDLQIKDRSIMTVIGAIQEKNAELVGAVHTRIRQNAELLATLKKGKKK